MIKNSLFLFIFFLFILFVLSVSIFFVYRNNIFVESRKSILPENPKKIKASMPVDEGDCSFATTTEIDGNMEVRRIDRRDQIIMDTPNKICSATVDEAINDERVVSGKRDIIINGKHFHGMTGCLNWNESCDKIEGEKVQKKGEVDKHRYNIVNSCLYDNGKRVSEKNLLLRKLDGEFEPEPGFGDDIKADISHYPEFLEEWMRYEHDGKLYIYLETGAGCGGCYFNGPYLEIDEKSGNVLLKEANLPWILTLILSPDKKMAIEVEMSRDGDGKHIFLYDIIARKRVKEIHTVPDNMTVVYDGDGTYPIPDSFAWLDDKTIKITQFKVLTDAQIKKLIAEDKVPEVQYGEADKPIVISLE